MDGALQIRNVTLALFERQKLRRLEQALRSYEFALHIDPERRDAPSSRMLVRRMMATLSALRQM
jgi:hypothetical protein